jgi:hypothetical protein
VLPLHCLLCWSRRNLLCVAVAAAVVVAAAVAVVLAAGSVKHISAVECCTALHNLLELNMSCKNTSVRGLQFTECSC